MWLPTILDGIRNRQHSPRYATIIIYSVMSYSTFTKTLISSTKTNLFAFLLRVLGSDTFAKNRWYVESTHY